MDDVPLYMACKASIWNETIEVHLNGDNHIQKFSFGEVNHWIYVRKSRFTATREAPLPRSRKTQFPSAYPTITLPKWKTVEYSYPLNLPYAIFPDANTVYTETVTMPTNHTRHMIEVTTNSSACLLYTTHSSFCRKCLTRNHLHERFVYRFLKILFCPRQWLSAEFSFHLNNLRPSTIKKNLW